MKVRITVSGCDDSTIVEVDLTPAGFAAVQKVAEAVTEESGCVCMPTMKVVKLAAEAGESR